MTRVVFQDAAADLITDPKELYDRYTGFGGGPEDSKIGGETERTYYSQGDPRVIMSAELQAEFLDCIRSKKITDPKTGRQRPIGFDSETVSQVIEEQTSAVPFEEFGNILNQEREIAAHMAQIASELGLRQSPFTNNPFATHDQCFRHPVAEPRHRTNELITALYQIMGHDALSYTFLTSPVHCSLSYNNPEQLWNMVRRMFYLTPFMYLAGDNSGNFMENCPLPLNHHFTMRTNQALGARGGVPDHFYRCRNGEGYIRGHIEAVFNTPMLIEFDDKGNERMPAHGLLRTPRRILKDKGWLNRSSFDLAESLLWPDGKICNIRDRNNVPVGKRFEVRMWDTGPHQFASMVLTCVALLMDTQGGEDCDRLLEDFGFGAFPEDAEDLHRDAMRTALYHGGRFMDIPFGMTSNGSPGSMRDFARELFPIIKEVIRRIDPTQLGRLQPLGLICKTGETDTKVICNRYKTLDGLAGFMVDCPLDIYTRPDGTSFYMLRETGELPEPRTGNRSMYPVMRL